MKLLLLGATGLVGSRALQLALSNQAFTEVIAAALLDAVILAKGGCRWIYAEEMN